MRLIDADLLSDEVFTMAKKARTHEMQTVLMAIERLIRATQNIRENEWISMDDETPNEAGTYLVYRGKAATCDWLQANSANYLVGTGFWNEDGKLWFYTLAEWREDKTVTHWMRMPTAPEGWE